MLRQKNLHWSCWGLPPPRRSDQDRARLRDPRRERRSWVQFQAQNIEGSVLQFSWRLFLTDGGPHLGTPAYSRRERFWSGSHHPVPPSPMHSRCPGGSSENRSEEHTSELQSLRHLVCRLLLEK